MLDDVHNPMPKTVHVLNRPMIDSVTRSIARASFFPSCCGCSWLIVMYVARSHEN